MEERKTTLELLTKECPNIGDYIKRMREEGFQMVSTGYCLKDREVDTQHRRGPLLVERTPAYKDYKGLGRLPLPRNVFSISSEDSDRSGVLDLSMHLAEVYPGIIYSPITERVVTSYLGRLSWDPRSSVPHGRLVNFRSEKLRLIREQKLNLKEKKHYDDYLKDCRSCHDHLLDPRIYLAQSGHLIREGTIFGRLPGSEK